MDGKLCEELEEDLLGEVLAKRPVEMVIRVRPERRSGYSPPLLVVGGGPAAAAGQVAAFGLDQGKTEEEAQHEPTRLKLKCTCSKCVFY